MKTRTMKTGHCIMMLTALLFLSCAVLLAPLTATAHAPSDVVLAYDKASKTLSVTIIHNVADPKVHYIKKVTIMSGETVMETHPGQAWNKQPVNIVSEDKVIQTHEYKSQPAPNAFTYTYIVNAVAGAKLSVVVECNYFGSGSGTVTVP